MQVCIAFCQTCVPLLLPYSICTVSVCSPSTETSWTLGDHSYEFAFIIRFSLHPSALDHAVEMRGQWIPPEPSCCTAVISPPGLEKNLPAVISLHFPCSGCKSWCNETMISGGNGHLKKWCCFFLCTENLRVLKTSKHLWEAYK